MSVATLDGRAVTRARVQLGSWGLWWADAELDDEAAVAGTADLVIAGETFRCTVVAGRAFEGRSAYRLVGGAGGWARSIPAANHVDDAGVRVATVLGDAARAAGETLGPGGDERAGPNYARRAGPAAAVLHDLAPRAWYVANDGTTRLGSRAVAPYTGEGTITRLAPDASVYEVACESLAGLAPGVVLPVTGATAASDVEIELTASRLTARVFTNRTRSRRLEALAKIVASLFPRTAYAGAWEFRVVLQQGERFALQPVRTNTGLSDLANVPVRPGVSGVRNQVTPGECVLVQFVDCDPSRPVITNHAAPDDLGWMPITLELGGPGALGVARMTDPIIAGPFGGTIVGASLRVKASL